MKRIIFSIFNGNVDQNHKSTDDYKLSQFNKFKPKLIQCKNDYAKKCNADFVLHEVPITDYNSLQFEKIIQLEKYADEYDEILYLDFDVIPANYARNIFDHVDTSKIGMHPLKRDLKHGKLRSALNGSWINNQNVFVKTCAKKSMLLLDGINGNDHLYNTGVVIGNSEIIKTINFSNQLDDLHDLLDEAKEDSLYPKEISDHFYYNNEVYMSYLVERDNIPHVDLTMNWNFIIDHVQTYPNSAGELMHYVRKEFEQAFV